MRAAPALLCALLAGAAPAARAHDHVLLADPARLARAADGAVAHWLRPGTDLRAYDKLLIERPRVATTPGATLLTPVDAADVAMLSDYLLDALRREAIAGGWKLVEAVEPGVLRLRTLLTDVQPNRPEVGLLVLAAPFGTVAEAAVSGAVSGTPGKAPWMGGVGIEAQFADAQSGTVLAELQDRRAGNRLAVDSGVEGLVTSYATGLSQWGYVKQAFDYWAKWIRERFAAARAKAP